MRCSIRSALRMTESTTTSRTQLKPAKRWSRCAWERESVQNLFLCNGQKNELSICLMMPGEKVFKTKDLSKQLGVARLSFASPEDMLRLLNITPGSVSVLGLMNDRENEVQLVIDKPVLEDARFGCHPCINSSTLAIATQDLMQKILPAVHHEAILVDLPEEAAGQRVSPHDGPREGFSASGPALQLRASRS